LPAFLPLPVPRAGIGVFGAKHDQAHAGGTSLPATL